MKAHFSDSLSKLKSKEKKPHDRKTIVYIKDRQIRVTGEQ